MEEEVKRWLEKKKSEMGKTSYEQVPVAQPKIEPQPETKVEPKIEPVQIEKPQPESQQTVAEEVLSEIPEEPEETGKHVETQAKIASDMETMKMGEMPIKSGMLTTRAKVLLVLIVALAIFIVYWTFIISPALISGE